MKTMELFSYPLQRLPKDYAYDVAIYCDYSYTIGSKDSEIGIGGYILSKNRKPYYVAIKKQKIYKQKSFEQQAVDFFRSLFGNKKLTFVVYSDCKFTQRSVFIDQRGSPEQRLAHDLSRVSSPSRVHKEYWKAHYEARTKKSL